MDNPTALETKAAELQHMLNYAKDKANEAAEEKLEDKSLPESNGSEAWQAVKLYVDGRGTIGRCLKALGMDKDVYWGFVISPISMGVRLNNYYAEEAWCNEFARILNVTYEIKASPVERLL